MEFNWYSVHLIPTSPCDPAPEPHKLMWVALALRKWKMGSEVQRHLQANSEFASGLSYMRPCLEK